MPDAVSKQFDVSGATVDYNFCGRARPQIIVIQTNHVTAIDTKSIADH